MVSSGRGQSLPRGPKNRAKGDQRACNSSPGRPKKEAQKKGRQKACASRRNKTAVPKGRKEGRARRVSRGKKDGAYNGVEGYEERRGEERRAVLGRGERKAASFLGRAAQPIAMRWAPRVGGDSSAPTGDVITRGRVRRCSLAPLPPPSPRALASGPPPGRTRPTEYPHHRPLRTRRSPAAADRVANFGPERALGAPRAHSGHASHATNEPVGCFCSRRRRRPLFGLRPVQASSDACDQDTRDRWLVRTEEPDRLSFYDR
ncbi:hypothetical protein KM043_002730 [Ampulex compressa]|nr:hypothetical protein KM043_002730 [Ampulex compressa]